MPLGLIAQNDDKYGLVFEHAMGTLSVSSSVPDMHNAIQFLSFWSFQRKHKTGAI